MGHKIVKILRSQLHAALQLPLSAHPTITAWHPSDKLSLYIVIRVASPRTRATYRNIEWIYQRFNVILCHGEEAHRPARKTHKTLVGEATLAF